MVLLDTNIAGCVSSSLSGALDEKRRGTLLSCLAAVEKVLSSVDDDAGAIEYYRRLRDMAVLVAALGNANARQSAACCSARAQVPAPAPVRRP